MTVQPKPRTTPAQEPSTPPGENVMSLWDHWLDFASEQRPLEQRVDEQAADRQRHCVESSIELQKRWLARVEELLFPQRNARTDHH